MVVLRLAESAGVGALLGCAIGLFFSLVLLWRGTGAIEMALMCVAGGALIGLAWGLSRRPTLSQAATEADRQLGLQDLLLTAVSIDGLRNEANSRGNEVEQGAQNEAMGSEPGLGGQVSRSPSPSRGGSGVSGGRNEAIDPFALLVMEMASARCGVHSPSELVMHRLGVRAWGGIGLAAALVLAVAGLATQVEQGRAETGRQAFLDVRQIDEAGRQNEAIDTAVAGRRREDPPGEGGAPPEHRSVLVPAPVDDVADTTAFDAPGPGEPSPAAEDGTGPGAARSAVDESPTGPHDPQTTPGRDAHADGEVRSGSGGRGEAAAGDWTDDPNGQRTGEAGSGQGTPAWTSGSPSPAEREAALESVRDGRIPAAYRDLVRDYFSPTP
jgi:hypothetical protein